jgi:hypothetical protein
MPTLTLEGWEGLRKACLLYSPRFMKVFDDHTTKALTGFLLIHLSVDGNKCHKLLKALYGKKRVGLI